LLALCELLERVDRLLALGVLGEDLLPERDGVGVAMQPLAGELGQLELVLEPRDRIARELRFLREDVVEAAPRPLLAIDLLELRERRPVVRLDRDELLE